MLQVRQLRERRRKNKEARENEAAAVMGLGQQQKTIVEERNKGERERQIAQIRDRVNRIKQERHSARYVFHLYTSRHGQFLVSGFWSVCVKGIGHTLFLNQVRTIRMGYISGD